MSPLVKKLTWALGLSLALNLFLLGFGAARWVGHRREHHAQLSPAPFGHGKGPRHWLGGPHAPALRAQHRELSRARKAVSEALAAEPFDRNALEAALTQLRATTSDGQKRVHEALLDTAAKLSLEERQTLARSKFLRDFGPPGPPPPPHD